MTTLMYWSLVIRVLLDMLNELVDTWFNAAQHWLREYAGETDEADEDQEQCPFTKCELFER